ncbi:MAG: S41 family peptidase [Bacteroidota bacterium]
MKRLLLLVLLFTFTISSVAQQKDKRTAFPKMLFKENQPYVEYEGEWVKLVRIAGKPIADYMSWAINDEPTNWQKAMVRYTHYMMDDFNIQREDSISVSFEHQGVEQTALFALKIENRELATTFWEHQYGQNRIQREHPDPNDPSLHYLTIRLDGYAPTAENWLSPAAVIADLEHLDWRLTHHYSYLHLTGFDYKRAIDAIIADLQQGITKADLALQLKMFMANFGDGHSRIGTSQVANTKLKSTNSPFLILKEEEQFYAINAAEHRFFNEAYPQLLAINNIPIQRLYACAERLVPKTTERYVERNTLEFLDYPWIILKMAGSTQLDTAKLTLSNGINQHIQNIKIDRYPFHKPMKRYAFRQTTLEQNIGYLAIQRKMKDEDSFIDTLHQAMHYFRTTDALIIDIRGNSGGKRDALKALLPYLIQQPVICNIARFRVDQANAPQPTNGYLEARFSYPESSANFNAEERACIKTFKTNFQPQYAINDAHFSDYHYMVVSPTQAHGTYYYDKPVIVLIDSGCFSASDIFAAGIRQGDRVQLLGEPTGGGSGYSKTMDLPQSGIGVKLSRIVSYQPDGHLYDGYGVQPDILVPYTLTDRMGQTDSQLAKALELLSQRK